MEGDTGLYDGKLDKMWKCININQLITVYVRVVLNHKHKYATKCCVIVHSEAIASSY